MSLSEELRLTCADDWHMAHRDHPFILAMGDGTLSLERFQYFMRQDYLFLIDYARVLAMAAAKTPDLASMGHWASLLDGTLNTEMELHRGFCADFGITPEDLEKTEPMPATVAYTDHLLRVAYEGDIEELSAALLPCQWGYDEVGRKLERTLSAPDGSFHARWVAGYAADDYREMTAWLRQFVDSMEGSLTEDQRTRMERSFQASTRYEYLFWDAAWNSQSWNS